MLAVTGWFDGEKVEMTEPLPFKAKRNVIVIFLDDSANEKDLLYKDREVQPSAVHRVSGDPVEMFCGIFQDDSSLTDELLKERKKDIDFEEKKITR